MIENKSVHFRQEITCHSTNGYRSIVFEYCAGNFFLCWFYVWIQAVQRELLAHCLFWIFFFFTQIMSDSFYQGIMLFAYSEKKNKKTKGIQTSSAKLYAILHKRASKCRHESLMCPLMKVASM